MRPERFAFYNSRRKEICMAHVSLWFPLYLHRRSIATQDRAHIGYIHMRNDQFVHFMGTILCYYGSSIWLFQQYSLSCISLFLFTFANITTKRWTRTITEGQWAVFNCVLWSLRDCNHKPAARSEKYIYLRGNKLEGRQRFQ